MIGLGRKRYFFNPKYIYCLDNNLFLWYNMTRILCKIPDTLIVTGIPSHTVYRFSNENNHIVEVNDEDVPDLLSKIRKQGCCGNPVEIINIFEIYEQS